MTENPVLIPLLIAIIGGFLAIVGIVVLMMGFRRAAYRDQDDAIRTTQILIAGVTVLAGAVVCLWYGISNLMS